MGFNFFFYQMYLGITKLFFFAHVERVLGFCAILSCVLLQLQLLPCSKGIQAVIIQQLSCIHISSHISSLLKSTERRLTLNEGFGLPKSLSFILAKTTSFSFGKLSLLLSIQYYLGCQPGRLTHLIQGDQTEQLFLTV